MRLSSNTALVLRKASLGPAAIARRAHLMRNPMDGSYNHASRDAYMIINGRGGPGVLGCVPGSPAKLGSLGDATAGQVASVAVGAAAKYGAASLAAYIGAGAAAGPIGLVVGAVVGILVTKVFNKQYLNVGEMNTAEAAMVSAFNQYRTIAGHAPGRAYGLPAMEAVWKGAVFSGLFPLNKNRQCFHEGCSNYPGDPTWVTGAVHGGAGTGAFSFPYAFSKMQASGMPSSPPTGQPGTTAPPAAVVLVDQYFLPFNAKDSPAWALPQSPLARQLLYDVADAFLAQQAVPTTPYIAVPNTTYNTAISPVTTTVDPTQGSVPALPPPPLAQSAGLPPLNTPPSYGYGSAIMPPGSPNPSDYFGPMAQAGPAKAGNQYDMVPVTNPATGQTSYVLNPNNPVATAPAGLVFNSPAPIIQPPAATPAQGSTPITAGLSFSNLPSWVVPVMLLGLALAVPIMKPAVGRRRRH